MLLHLLLQPGPLRLRHSLLMLESASIGVQLGLHLCHLFLCEAARPSGPPPPAARGAALRRLIAARVIPRAAARLDRSVSCPGGTGEGQKGHKRGVRGSSSGRGQGWMGTEGVWHAPDATTEQKQGGQGDGIAYKLRWPCLLIDKSLATARR